jgi:hypothetical protein
MSFALRQAQDRLIDTLHYALRELHWIPWKNKMSYVPHVATDSSLAALLKERKLSDAV